MEDCPQMTTVDLPGERRKYHRFQVGLEAPFTLSPYCIGLGQILDISLGGLSFNAMTDVRQVADSPIELDIFFGNDLFCIKNVPGRIVLKSCRDQRLAPLVSRLCGVQFGELTERQHSQLEYLIVLNASDQHGCPANTLANQ